MFPRDAITLNRFNNTGSDLPNSLLLATGTRTVLHVDVMTQDGRNVNLSCGTSTFFYQQDYGGAGNEIDANFVCTQAIYLQLFRNSSFSMTYVDRDRNTDFDPPLSATSSVTVNTGTSTVSLVPEMTTASYIYLIMATVALLFYIFKK